MDSLPLYRCSKCKQEKTADKFYRSRGASTGLTSRCRDCTYQRVDRNRTPEQIRDYEQGRYEARKAAGLCAACGKRPPEPDRTLCEHCKMAGRKRHDKWRRETLKNRLCIRCGLYPICKDSLSSCRICLTKRYGINENDKDAVFELYGGQCACCGLGDWRFLTIDHINNDGSNDRRGDYRRFLKEYRDDIQILCWNCNMAKEKNGGVCPHRIEVKGKGWNILREVS